MSDSNQQAQRGFSVLEALISLSVFLAALTAVLVTYSSSRHLFVRGERRVEIQQNARLAMAEMSREIRMAGYFPENFGASPPTPRLDDAIRVASDDALAIYGDATNTGTSNVFLYCLDGTTLRRTQAAANSATGYICTNGDVLAENAQTLRFTFYDGDGNPLPTPPTTPYVLDDQDVGGLPDMTVTTQRGQVRRVVITLTVREELPHNEEHVYTLTSDVVLRNAG